MTATAHRPAPYVVHNSLALYRLGDGEPVLLMAGPHRFQQPGDGSAAPLIGGLVRLGRQVISFDPPGSGSSDRPARLNLEEMHGCADEALQVCGVSGPVDAMGHSMGGLTVLAYALERPGRVKRLVLVGTGSGGPAYMRAPGALWNRSHPAFWGMAPLGILSMIWPRRAPERMLNNYIRRHSFYDPSRAEPEEVRPGDWHYKVARKIDCSARLGEIEFPTLILSGRHDPQYPPACFEELDASIRGSRIVYFERSGHYLYIEEPEPFWSVVDRFLSENRIR